MLVGLDGTVGGVGVMFRAAGGKLAQSWKAMNEPIRSSSSRQAGGSVLTRTVGGISGGAKAIGAQIGKVGEGLKPSAWANAEYEQEVVREQLKTMKNYGFVSQLCRAYRHQRGGYAHYRRGPTTLGLQDREIVDEAELKVSIHRREGEELIVAGYSRGGLNAINLCERIVAGGGLVDVLILFDPVDRDVALGGCTISAGVRHCVLAQRGGAFITWKPCKVKHFGVTHRDVWLTKSRWNFGRMVNKADEEKLCFGKLSSFIRDATHAAFGGVPWTGDNPAFMTQHLDRDMASEVAQFVNGEVYKSCEWDPGLALSLPVQTD